MTGRVTRVALYGGWNYGDPDESFVVASLAEARDMWRDRVDSNGARKCRYPRADGTVEWFYAPCWGQMNPGDVAAYAWLNCDPTDDDPIHEYPDRVLRVGTRGGLSWETA